QRLGERVPVPRVLGAVAGQHARPDDLSGREARIVDRERLRIAHHLKRGLAAGDEPAVQDRHPPDRPQRCENRMRIRLELLQRDLGGHAVDSAGAGRAGTGIRVQSQDYALVSAARFPATTSMVFAYSSVGLNSTVSVPPSITGMWPGGA